MKTPGISRAFRFSIFIVLALLLPTIVSSFSRSAAPVIPNKSANGFSAIKDAGFSTINGINFTAPDREIAGKQLDPLVEAGADWISIIPYGFCKPGETEVWFNSRYQWWGERTEGVIETIKFAKQRGLLIMLKPHIWVMGQGWLGDFDFKQNVDWKNWENAYSKYILHYAHIADSLDVEMLCIGTEARISSKDHPEYWRSLITEVRKVYDGKLTYAANWDNYKHINFWDDLDFIGIDAYFPLTEHTDANLEHIIAAWAPWQKELKKTSSKFNKPVIFTEYGYMSVSGTAGKNWELENQRHELKPDMQAQVTAYQALYRRFWGEEWFAGGFIWKWYYDHSNAGGLSDTDYTPQNKPVMQVIRQYYGS